MRKSTSPQTLFSLLPLVPRAQRWMFDTACSIFLLFATGCQVLTYTSPTGEHFSRSSLGSTTALSSLSVVADTNGLRRVELRGYTNDSANTLGLVTAAAVEAAIQSVK